jgi:hypothetical protein
VYAWINTKNMPAHRIDRFWKYKPKEIDQWVHDGGAAGSLQQDASSREDK